MRLPLLLLVGLGLAGCDASVANAQGQRPAGNKGVAVVELFTSEGCSSCPPADRLLARLRDEPSAPDKPIFYLSLHVDYWNDLGWADPFSSATFSERQQAYSRAQGRSGVFTPEAIVNGAVSVNGSSESGLRAAIAATPASDVKLSLHVERKGPELTVHYEAGAAPAGSKLVALAVERSRTSAVTRGENRGETLRHVNVVRKLETASINPGAPRGDVQIGVPDGASPSEVVGLVQLPSMRIVAAASQPVPDENR